MTEQASRFFVRTHRKIDSQLAGRGWTKQEVQTLSIEARLASLWTIELPPKRRMRRSISNNTARIRNPWPLGAGASYSVPKSAPEKEMADRAVFIQSAE